MPEKNIKSAVGKFRPGHSGNPAGRPRGVPNKTTQLLKDAVLAAATEAGGGDLTSYLTKQARDNPVAFMSLLGKVLPLQVAQEAHAAPEITEIRIVSGEFPPDHPKFRTMLPPPTIIEAETEES